MTNIPTIQGSAQARLLLYRLFNSKLSAVEQRLLENNPTFWENLLMLFEKEIEADFETKANQVVLAQAFEYINQTTVKGLERQLSRISPKSLWIGQHPTSLLESFINEHTQLIKSVRKEHLDKIGLGLMRGIREGRLQRELEKDIRNVTGISKRRSQLIARNAPLQYSGALTKYHQTNAGIKNYRWQTSQDERVRASHHKRNGVVYSWNDPGPHPRSEVNCRCDAVPILT